MHTAPTRLKVKLTANKVPQLTLDSVLLSLQSVDQVIPHLSCKKFVAKFRAEAMKFVNSRRGKELCLRGINAKVPKSGVIRTGDTARKLSRLIDRKVLNLMTLAKTPHSERIRRGITHHSDALYHVTMTFGYC